MSKDSIIGFMFGVAFGFLFAYALKVPTDSAAGPGDRASDAGASREEPAARGVQEISRFSAAS
jgi:hypothetical protein